MKKLVINTLVVILLWTSAAFAISFADSYKVAGVYGTYSHQHITTIPSKVYAVTITPVVNGGYAKILDTKGPLVTSEYQNAYNHVIVYAKGATAYNTVHLVYPEGIPCFGAMMVSCAGAEVNVYYKQ